MDIKIIPMNIYKRTSDTKIVMCYESGETVENRKFHSQEILKKLDYLIKNNEFSGKFREVISLNLAREEYPQKIVFVGLGKKEELEIETIRKVLGKAIKEIKKLRSKSLEISVIDINCKLNLEEYIKVVTEAVLLADYKFDKYMSKELETNIEILNIIGIKENIDKLRVYSDEGTILGKTTMLARDLVNEPANLLTPQVLAEEAINVGNEYGFETEIFNEKEIKELGMKAFLEVSKASQNLPKLIIMRYLGNKESNEIVGLVGKGITYDSGGLSLKSKSRLITMKHDMAGGASVIGAISAIAKMNLKVNVVGIIAACENMLSSSGYKPGDIIESMAGKTILIRSTDAEGRLTLIDAIHYGIEKEGINKIIDIASLTGGARLAFGGMATAVLVNDDDLYNRLEIVSKTTGERFWKMPIYEDCRNLIKSDIADLLNSSEGDGAKMMVGGMFIREFIQDKPWMHLDIAGTCWSDSEFDYLSNGGTGVGVRSLYYLLKSFTSNIN